MKLKPRYRLFYFVILVTLASCTKRVEMDLQAAGASKLVVWGEITNEAEQHEIRLGKSAPYFANKPVEPVPGAVVTVADGDQKVTLKEDSIRTGVYLTPPDYSGKVGHQYHLAISHVDINEDGKMESYHAETVMKPSAPIKWTKVVYNPLWRGWEVMVSSESIVKDRHYYLFKVYKNGVLYTDSLSKYWTTDERFLNANEINGTTVQFFTKDKGEFVYKGDTITIEMDGITREYNDFINGILDEISEKVPMFSGPSANVKGNISNGALGFFAVMDVERSSVVYNGEGEKQPK
ncbi:MAG TPA: DUF4249 family protein [Sunxiuqinia sp.]|nr:DUF4249 family protein [Sunxiuqinia sp.]